MSFRDYQKKVRAAQAGQDVDWSETASLPETGPASTNSMNEGGAESRESPFRQHQKSVRSQLAASPVTASGIAPAIDDENPGAKDYHALLAVLHEDLRQLSDIHSHDARKPLKLEKAETYRAWVEGALEAGEQGAATQDQIVGEMLVWALDYGDYPYALRIASHMIANGVAMPERFKCSVATFLADEVAKAALGTEADVSLSILQHVSGLTADHDMHDEKRAKLHKALGRAYVDAADAYDPAADNAVAGGKHAWLDAALGQMKRALQLDKNAGVKKDIEKIERQLKELGPTPATDADGDEIEDPSDTGQEEEE